MKDDEEEYPESRGMKMLDLEPLELHEQFDRLLVAICSTRNDLPLQQLPLSRFLRHDRGRNQTRAMHHEFVSRCYVSFPSTRILPHSAAPPRPQHLQRPLVLVHPEQPAVLPVPWRRNLAT